MGRTTETSASMHTLHHSAALALLVLAAWTFTAGCSKTNAPEDSRADSWKVFTMASTQNALVSDIVNDLLIGENDRVWIATDSGVSAYFRGTWQSFSREIEFSVDTSSTRYRRVACITRGFDLSVWFGLAGGGVKRHSDGGSGTQWVTYTTDDGLLSNYVRAATSDRVGDLWFATGIGICRFHPIDGSNDGVWTAFPPSGGTLPSGNITAIRAHPVTGVIWSGSRNGDLVSYDGFLLWEQFKVPKNASPVRCIAFEDASGPTPVGSVWVGTDNGAFKYTPTSGWQEFSRAATGGSLPSDFVNAIVITIQGTVWFGTDRGLVKYGNNTWSVFHRDNSPLPSERILALEIDATGNLWIGTSGGVVQFNEDGIR